MGKKLIIALSGAAGSGKDTIAHRLIETGKWGKYAFASPLKRGVSTILNIPMEDLENPAIKNQPNYKFGRSLRYIMQVLGTEWGRNLIADDIWIQLAKENIGHQLEHVDNIVITDCRFDNEADTIHEMGGYVIKIVRDDNPHTQKVSLNGVEGKHASESGVSFDKVDFVLYNNGTLQEFEEKSLAEINRIIGEHYQYK